jgi:predicted DNA-binding transcriptional regulator AlpA
MHIQNRAESDRAGSPDRLLMAVETARLLKVSLSWLAKARLRGDGPRFVKIGRAGRYRDGDVRDYVRARTRTSTSEQS